MLNEELRAAAAGFSFPGRLTDAEEIGTGHVNRTWCLTFDQPRGRYILQKLSAQAFRHPEQVMENARRVCQHIEGCLAAMGVSGEDRVLRFMPARDGGLLFCDEAGGSWRAYRYIDGLCFLQADSLDRLREMGRAFGQFQRLLRDFPAGELYETIPFFHHTPRRYEAFRAAVERDAAGRAAGVRREIEFFSARADGLDAIVRRLESGELPVRAVHNDAKVSNVLFDAADGSALLLLDLDTVMPGSSLYDFGDIVRTGASTAAEDEPRGMALDLERFRVLAEGYLQEAGEALAAPEIRLLPLGARVITCEIAMRFLTDYLDGDVYFRVATPEHNLVRARAQMKLLEDIERKSAAMDAIIAEYAPAP
ncbi:MAG TPA: aminoglycoside phosphotransferase family protein [Candidatus Pullichristensenella stercoripullorum]|nr:aminoglycoside phosphotransferase family protein [Candidatus Pullichristensenella stercoripullorum]